MLLTFIGLVIFSVVFVFSVSNTKYHILCSSIVSLIHVNTTIFRNITCTVVATGVILRSSSVWDGISSGGGTHQKGGHFMWGFLQPPKLGRLWTPRRRGGGTHTHSLSARLRSSIEANKLVCVSSGERVIGLSLLLSPPTLLFFSY